MIGLLRTPILTPRRIWLALAVAVTADAVQLLLAAPGWFFFDEAIDLGAMALMCVLLGFHPLFLPTFVAEFIPIVGMLPTWTACTIAVVALRRRQQRTPPSSAPPPINPRDKVIDI